jgi:hypothetical protein
MAYAACPGKLAHGKVSIAFFTDDANAFADHFRF